MFRQSNPKRSQAAATPTSGPAAAAAAADSSAPPSQTSNVQTISVRPLDRCLVSYTGLTAAERSQVNRLVRTLGGRAAVDMTEDVNYLIANKTMTPKYKQIAFTLTIPVVEPSWLQEIHQEWSMGREVNLKETRTEIENYTTLYGGSFTPDMIRGKTTHLICDVAKGKKFTMAQLWGIKCVSYKWFVECMRVLDLVDESAYPAPTEEERREEKMTADPTSNPIMDIRADAIPDMSYLEECHFYLCPTFDEEGMTKCKTMIRMGGGLQVANYDDGEVTHVIVPEMTIHESTMRLFKDAQDLPCIVSFQWLKACSKAHKRIPESQYVVPFPTRSEATHPKNQHLHGPQTWTTDPVVTATSSRRARPRLEDTRASNVATIRSRGSTLESAREASGADGRQGTPGSTFQQHREQRPLSPPTSPPSSPPSSRGDSSSPKHTRRALVNRTLSGLLAQDVADLSINRRLSNGLSSSLSSMVDRTDNLGLHDASGNGGTQAQSAGSHPSKSASSGNTLSSVPEDDDDSDSETERARNKDLFTGLSFTTYGCKEDTVETVRMETEQHGGKFYEEGTVPVQEQDTAYTIVPRSMRRADTEHLKGFVVTTAWIEKCVIDGRLAPKRGFLYRPLENVPIEGFSDLNISLSSTLDELEFIQLTKLVKILGATYHENVLKSSTNLLITNAAQGPKFEFMWKNNRPVVTCEWLKQSVAAQQRSDSPILADSSPVFTDTPLSGLVLCVTNKALSECQDLVTIIQDLGGQVVRQYNQSITHVVHKAVKARDTFKDLRQAKTDRKFVVAPEWVLKCRDERHLVDERLYPETYDPKRRVLETTLPPPTRSKTLPAAAPKRPTMRSSSNSASASLGGSSGGYNNTKHSTHSSMNSRSQRMSIESSQVYSQMTESASYFYGALSMEMSSSTTPYESMTQDPSMQHLTQIQAQQQQQHPSLSLSVDTSMSNKIRRGRKRERTVDVNLTLQGTLPSAHATGAGSEPSSATSATVSFALFREQASVAVEVDEGIDYSDEEGRAVRRKHMRRVDTTGWAAAREEQQEKEDESQRSCGPGTADVSMQEDGDMSATTTMPLRGGGGNPYQFLLTGIRFDERDQYKKSIKELGGIILEDETDQEEVWRQRCTHLLTNARNPPRTAKLLMARELNIPVVFREYVVDSKRAGKFLPEANYLV
ncbi:DNA topoisomerase 2-binding protein 1 [Actinomortierella ambigua]|nr:DNA topoisomerase 2-binding protein 1 [Actinomortierella ambigua]